MTDPWDDDGAPPPRQFGWGCLAAVIIASIATVVALVIVIQVIAAAFTG
jgi:hypothetical protein